MRFSADLKKHNSTFTCPEKTNIIAKLKKGASVKVIGEFKLAGNSIKMSSYKDENKRGDIPDLDEHRNKILKEFS